MAKPNFKPNYLSIKHPVLLKRFKVVVVDIRKIDSTDPRIANTPKKRIAIFDAYTQQYVTEPQDADLRWTINSKCDEMNKIEQHEFAFYNEVLTNYLNDIDDDPQ